MLGLSSGKSVLLHETGAATVCQALYMYLLAIAHLHAAGGFEDGLLS